MNCNLYYHESNDRNKAIMDGGLFVPTAQGAFSYSRDNLNAGTMT
jgi:hypothetical protein